jgi:hypothetical protein
MSCLLSLSIPLKSNFKTLFPSRNRLLSLSLSQWHHFATSRSLSRRTQKSQSSARTWKHVHAGRWHVGRSSPVPQHMLKMLPSWRNALSTAAEDVVYSSEIAEISLRIVFMSSSRVCGSCFIDFICSNFPTVLNQGDVGGQRQCPIRCHVSSLALFSNGSEILVVDSARLALRISGFVARKCISALQGCNSLPRLKCSAEQLMFLMQLYFWYGSAGKCRRNFISAVEWFDSVYTKGSELSICSVMAHGRRSEGETREWSG